MLGLYKVYLDDLLCIVGKYFTNDNYIDFIFYYMYIYIYV